MKRTLLSLTALTLFACGQGLPTATSMARLDTSAMIPLADAIAIASARLPGGFIVSAKLDDEDVGVDPENEPKSYEVVVFTAASGELWHVGVDVATGEILEAEVENSETAQ